MKLSALPLALLCSAVVLSATMSCTGRRGVRANRRAHTERRSPSSDDGERASASHQRRVANNDAPRIAGVSHEAKSGKALTAQQIYRQCNPAVFTILVSDGAGRGAQGSGFFVTASGYAVTNHHVIDGAYEGVVQMANGRQYRIVEVITDNADEDYAIIKVAVQGRVPFLPIARNKAEVGEKVFAIGSPKGLTNTISEGIISQFREQYLQISVPIDHGSSGGALLNTHGQVVGITTAGRDDSNADLNFAVDIHTLPL